LNRVLEGFAAFLIVVLVDVCIQVAGHALTDGLRHAAVVDAANLATV
jgi:hypothetical protein